MEKITERYVNEEGAVEEIVTFRAYQTDEGLVTKLNQLGPVCSEEGCLTRLHAEHVRRCKRCDRPLCREHSYLLGGQYYHKACRRIAAAKASVRWLFSPFGSRKDEQ